MHICEEQKKLHLFVLLGVLNSICKTIGDVVNPFAKLHVVFDINKLNKAPCAV
jgi:hypothetical protein